jgi:hypothetical protein
MKSKKKKELIPTSKYTEVLSGIGGHNVSLIWEEVIDQKPKTTVHEFNGKPTQIVIDAKPIIDLSKPFLIPQKKL